MKRLHTTFSALLAIGAFTLLLGCDKKPALPTGPTPVSAPALAALATADAFDGKKDKVVSKCAGCALHMDGKAELTLPVQDFAMHFCSQKCLDRFKADPDKEILAMKLPK